MIHKNKLILPKGIGIIEALVAVTVFTLGLVGVSKLMAVSLKSTQNSEMQGRVAILVTDAMERMRILGTSSGSVAKNAFLDGASCAGLSEIELEQCTLGSQSREEWNQQVQNNIPSAVISVCRKSSAGASSCSSNNSSDTIVIDIKWTQKIVGKGKANDTVISSSYTTNADF